MKRNLLITLLLVLFLIPATRPGALAADPDGTDAQFRIRVRNRTAQPVILTLAGLEQQGVYRFIVPPGVEQAFSVKAGRYAQTTFACSSLASGTLEVFRQLRLTFTPCASAAPNAGAPALEKVHLTDAPRGLMWSYQYGPLLKGLVGSGGGSGVGVCDFTAIAEVTIYTRPHTTAEVFSVQPAGFTIQPSARSAGGWLGFEPGTAQAANIGPFRLRWLAPGSGVVTAGCSGLPVIWTPKAGICYDMPMFPVEVHASPDISSQVLFVLQMGEFAQVLGHTPGGDWVRVDLAPGNTGSNVVGWVESGTTNVNGPCSDLPVINP